MKKVGDTSWIREQEYDNTAICNKIEFKLKLIRRVKESHFTQIKVQMNDENFTELNIYVPNFGALN